MVICEPLDHPPVRQLEITFCLVKNWPDVIMPTAVALSSSKIVFVRLAMRCASVVLPHLRPMHITLAWGDVNESVLTQVNPIK